MYVCIHDIVGSSEDTKCMCVECSIPLSVLETTKQNNTTNQNQ